MAIRIILTCDGCKEAIDKIHDTWIAMLVRIKGPQTYEIKELVLCLKCFVSSGNSDLYNGADIEQDVSAF